VDNYDPYVNTIKKGKQAFFSFISRVGNRPSRLWHIYWPSAEEPKKRKITAKSVNYESEKPSNPGIYRIRHCQFLSQEAGSVQRDRLELQ
jgi:hypothetical protein